MNALRRQFFLSYGVFGSIVPLMTVYLRQQGGFTFWEVGLTASLMALPMLCSPALFALLADRQVDSRRILAAAFSCSAVVLSLIFFFDSIFLILLGFTLHGLAFVAMMPLQDGYYFQLAVQVAGRGGRVPAYPRIRVWGTMGFILPSLILFVPLSRGAGADSILPCAVFFCVLSLGNSFTLPRLEKSFVLSNRMPTGLAFRALWSGRGKWFALGLLLALTGSACYYTFIGNYLDEVVGMPKGWIGLVINLGVLLEVGYMLGMPSMQRRMGLKGVVIVGLACMAVRMGLLAFFPHPWVAVGIQLVHGVEVLALFVAPIMFLNRLATNEYRNSIQGVYTMTVAGLAKVLGGVAAGAVVTQYGLKAGMLWGAGLAVGALVLLGFFFSRWREEEA